MVASTATIIMASGVLTIRWILAAFNLTNPAIRLSSSVVVGMAIYIVALFRLGGPLTARD